ncbi:MAG: phage portal protein [Ruminococcus sp.]|nr:phage portal protein [Ruminococcus sp.]
MATIAEKLKQFAFRSRDRPKDETEGSRFRPFFGASTSNKRVSEKTAMQLTAVYACIKVLSESVAQLPLHLYINTDEKGKRLKATEHPLYFLLHDEPNPEMSSFVFREVMMTHLLVWGNAYAQIIRNGKNEVTALYPLMADRITVSRNDKGLIEYQYTTSNIESGKGGGKTVTLPADQVFHLPAMGFDGLVGYSPLAMAKNAVGTAIACEEYGSKFFTNAAAPSGVLEHPGTLKNPDKLRESWNALYRGSANSSKVAVLEEGMTYKPISITPEQVQFLETRKFQTGEIARIYRVPGHMIGDLEWTTYANIEQQSLEFVKYTLDPWLVRWEQEIKRKLLTGDEKKNYYAKFNVDGLLRGDYASRMQGYALGRQNGWYSANDIRNYENMELIPEEEGGDLYLINGNMTKIKDAGIFAGNSGTTQGGE